MAAALARLAVALPGVADLRQHLADRVGTDPVAQVPQGRGQFLAALGHPQQRAHRVAQGRRLHKTAQIVRHRRVRTAQPRPATTRTPHPHTLRPRRTRKGRRNRSQLLRPAYDGAPRNTRRPEHRRRPAATRRSLLRRNEQAAAPLV